LNQILRRQTSRSHYGSKVPAVTVTVFKYRNKIGKIVVKAVPYMIVCLVCGHTDMWGYLIKTNLLFQNYSTQFKEL
jgi:hypothetical protein